MRSLDEARPSWTELGSLRDLQELRTLVADFPAGAASTVVTGQRSVCWKAFLLFENLDFSGWSATLSDSRSAYDALRTHFLHAIDHPDDVDFVLDPLSDNQESPWNALRADEALREEIFQDVERCMPESVYFRQPQTQKMLLDILFIFCKLNPDVSYRQGMHEVLAPILRVVERDALSPESLERSTASKDDELLIMLLDPECIEHDTFTLFGLVMQNAKAFYEQPGNVRRTSQPSSQNESAMLLRCRKIFEYYLPKVDPGLAAHLKQVDIVPQIFLMRWIRLLFGREFPLDDVLQMWDFIFAEDTSLDIVDLISVSMLLRIRWQLIDADTNTALTLLLHYPSPPRDHSPRSFIKDALFLKKNLTPESGSHIVAMYTKRPLPLLPRVKSLSSEPLQSSRRISGRSAHRVASPTAASLGHRKTPSSGLENLIQDAARGVYTQGEKWGFNKAVRDAALSVRKNIADLQSTSPSQTTVPRMKLPGFLVNSPSSSAVSEDPIDVSSRLEALEQRNKMLAKMLEKAVSDLWAFQKDKVEHEHGKKAEKEQPPAEGRDALDKLSVAVATVQLVQVYLDDSSIPLPPSDDDESRNSSESVTATAPPIASGQPLQAETRRMDSPGSATSPILKPSTSATAPHQKQRSASPAISTVPARRKESRAGMRGSVSAATPAPAANAQSPTNAPEKPASSYTSANSASLSRPALAQSSFSWMLGQEETDKKARETFGAGSRYVSSGHMENVKGKGSGGADGKGGGSGDGGGKEERRKGMGFLFGEEEWELERKA